MLSTFGVYASVLVYVGFHHRVPDVCICFFFETNVLDSSDSGISKIALTYWMASS